MVKLEFTVKQQHQLRYERYHHPHPRRQRKMDALWLNSQGMGPRQISRLTGLSSTTLTSDLPADQANRIEGLKTVNCRRPQSLYRGPNSDPDIAKSI